MERLVVIKGGGDIATGIAHRLFRSGFRILITELAQPTVIRRTVAFAEALYTGETTVEGVRAVSTEIDGMEKIMNCGAIPVIADPYGECLPALRCIAVVDAILSKRNTGTRLRDAAIVIGVGPGFMAGKDVHAVIETMRGHDLGRVLYEGNALPNTGIPGEIGGFTSERVLRAPCEGIFYGKKKIGDIVSVGDEIGAVGSKTVKATISGVLRGLLHNGLFVTEGMKIGDVDPRCQKHHCFTISDKARAVGGGVLEAILTLNKSGYQPGYTSLEST